jgi:thiamine kinase-like enzyme
VDLGNHFNEWTVDYDQSEYPFFSIDHSSDWPSPAEQDNFLEAYAKKSAVPLEILVREAAAGAMASHMLWGLWGIIQARRTDINFGYLEFGVDRLRGYFVRKQDWRKGFSRP